MIQRNGVYYYRKAVPPELRSIIGKREILVSLKTKDRETAKQRHPYQQLKADRDLADARKKLAAVTQTPEVLADQWKHDLLTEDAEARSLLAPKTREDLGQEIADLDGALAEVKSYLTFGDIAQVQHSFLSVLERYGVKLDPESPAFRRAVHAFLRAGVEAIKVLQNRSRGDWSDMQTSTTTPPLPLPPADPEHNPPLSLVLEKCRKERQPPTQTWHEWRVVFQRFKELVGDDLPVQAVTKAHVRSFKDALMRAPRRVPKRFRGRPFAEVLAATEDDGTPRLSTQSVHKALSAIQGVLSWAIKQGYIEHNPAIGLKPEDRNRDGEDRRLPYDTADIKLIFSSPLFTGCKSASRRTEPGAFVVKDASYWLPFLSLYTGARLEELGQLLVSDVKEEDGVTYFDIRGGNGKRLKTASSKRRVPVHPELLRLGFLDYLNSQNGSRLFPDLRPDVHGKVTGRWTKWYGRYTHAIGITDPRKVFHSFRHSFKDACRRAGIPEEVHDALTGHSGGGVGRSYGLGVPLRVLAGAVEKVAYPDLPI